MEVMIVSPGKSGSLEDLLHQENASDRYILLHSDGNGNDHAKGDQKVAKAGVFERSLGHRAIGVVYHPQRERGNYVPTYLMDRYNAFMFLDQTTSLHPIHMPPHHELIPETYPFGF